jgi:hypothetical protein
MLLPELRLPEELPLLVARPEPPVKELVPEAS